jgi:hypothetical protein
VVIRIYEDSLLDSVIENLMLFGAHSEYPIKDEAILLWSRAELGGAKVDGLEVFGKGDHDFTTFANF